MKFKESKSIIENGLDDNDEILISMNGEIYKSLERKGDKKGELMGRDIISRSFKAFFDDGVWDKDGNPGDDFILINKESWNYYLNLI